MDTFHSHDSTENSQNLLENRFSKKAVLNARLLQVGYSREEGSLEEEIFDAIDQVFEADCSSLENYEDNLEELVDELDEQKYQEFIELTGRYGGVQE